MTRPWGRKSTKKQSAVCLYLQQKDKGRKAFKIAVVVITVTKMEDLGCRVHISDCSVESCIVCQGQSNIHSNELLCHNEDGNGDGGDDDDDDDDGNGDVDGDDDGDDGEDGRGRR